MRMRFTLVLTAASLCFGTVWGAEATLTKLEVSPPDVNLLTSRGKQVFVVQATYSDGLTRDVTGQAKATLANDKLAKLDKNLITPVADGETRLNVEFGGKKVEVAVKV